MNSYKLYAKWVAYIGLGMLLLTPLIVSQSMYFPFITGKNFFFRIITEIVFVAWVSLAFLDASFRPRTSPILYAFGAFVSVTVVAGAFGVNPYHSFWSNFERMEGVITYLHLFALFLAAAHVLKDAKDWLRFAYVSIGVSGFIALFTIAEGFNVIEGYGNDPRPFATFGNFIYLAVYLMTHMFVVGGLLASTWKNHAYRWSLIALEVVLFIAFVLPASRGAFVGLVAGIGSAALLTIIFSRHQLLRMVSAGVLVAGLLVFAGIKFFPESAVVQRVPLFKRVAFTSLTNITDQPRVKIWGMAIEAAQERPLLGWGPDTFIIPFAKYYNPTLYGNEPWFDRTHNVFLEWLVDAGFLGFIAFLSIHLAALYSLYRLWRTHMISSVVALAMAGGYGAYLMQNFFVFDTITTYLTLVFALAFLHALSISHDASTPKRANPALTSIVPAGALVAVTMLIFFVNVQPIKAAKGTIDVLMYFQQQKTLDEITTRMDSVVELRTFGTRELRERFGIIAMDVLLRSKERNASVNALLAKSLDEMQEQVKAEPQVLKNRLLLARLLSIQDAQGIPGAQAEEIYKGALIEAPTYIQAYLSYAELQLARNKYPEALELVTTAYELAGKPNSLFSNIVNVHLQSGNTKAAQDFLQSLFDQRTVSSLSRDEIDSFLQRAFFISDARQRLQFVEYLESHAEQEGGSAYMHLVLAQTYADLGDKQNAVVHAKKAMEMNPGEYTQPVTEWLKAIGAQ